MSNSMYVQFFLIYFSGFTVSWTSIWPSVTSVPNRPSFSKAGKGDTFQPEPSGFWSALNSLSFQRPPVRIQMLWAHLSRYGHKHSLFLSPFLCEIKVKCHGFTWKQIFDPFVEQTLLHLCPPAASFCQPHWCQEIFGRLMVHYPNHVLFSWVSDLKNGFTYVF